MVVISGENMKDKNNPDVIDSACQGENLQSLQSSFPAGNCTIQFSPSLTIDPKNSQNSCSEVDLYGDMEPEQTANSNGRSATEPFTEPVPHVAESEPYSSELMNNVGAVAEQPSVLSESFKQLVSETLVGVGEGSDMLAEEPHPHYSTAEHYSSLEVSEPQAAVDCNGSEESSSAHYFNQGEVIFSNAGATFPSGSSVSIHAQRDGGETEELNEDIDDDVEHSESSDEFDDEDHAVARAACKKKATESAKHLQNQSAESIMVIDSDEEGDCDDDMDGEEMEEEMLPEEEEEADPEEYDEDEEDYPEEESLTSPSESQLKRTSGEYEQHKTARKSVNSEFQKELIVNQNSPKVKDGSHNGTNGAISYDNNGKDLSRDHDSIMKKFKFNQEINLLKRKRASEESFYHRTDAVEDNFNEEEEDGWQELAKWNEMREKTNDPKGNTNSDVQIRLSETSGTNNNSNNIVSGNVKTRVPAADAAASNNYSTKSFKHSSSLLDSTVTHNDEPSVKSHDAPASQPISQVIPSEVLTQSINVGTVSSSPPVSSLPSAANSILIPQLNEAKGYFEIGCCNEDPQLTMHVISLTVIFAKNLSEVCSVILKYSCVFVYFNHIVQKLY